jgi:uncharacterized repeat protein (TIGR03833 family)
MSGDGHLKHKALSVLRGVAATPHANRSPQTPAPQAPLGRLVVREEFDSDEGRVIVRVIGVPVDRLRGLGARLREALGGVVLIEGRDLLATQAPCEEVAAWLHAQGASDAVVVKREVAAPLADKGAPGGTERSGIRRGLRVAVVLKADQEAGTLTEGVVRDILTSSPVHPRGIKVRLESGQVGRVRRILG